MGVRLAMDGWLDRRMGNTTEAEANTTGFDRSFLLFSSRFKVAACVMDFSHSVDVMETHRQGITLVLLLLLFQLFLLFSLFLLLSRQRVAFVRMNDVSCRVVSWLITRLAGYLSRLQPNFFGSAVRWLGWFVGRDA